MREIAASNIIEATALARLERANRHKTVPSIERSEHKPGDLVDIWYDPSHKEQQGWRGPAQVALIQESDGVVAV